MGQLWLQINSLELELLSSPGDGLDLPLSMSWIDTEVENVDFNGVVADRRNAFTLELQATALIRHSWELTNGQVAAQFDTSYTDETFFSLSNWDAIRIDSYAISNFRLSYLTSDNRWEIAAYVKNLSDERYETFGFDLSTF